MNWWISIGFYLCRNSARIWLENPLPALGKLVVAALIALMGSMVMLGVGQLGVELDRRLTDREMLTAFITEDVPAHLAPEAADAEAGGPTEWASGGFEALTVLRLGTFADSLESGRLAVIALPVPEAFGFDDDVYLLHEAYPEGIPLEIEIEGRWSSALSRKPGPLKALMGADRTVVASAERLAPLLARGFAKVTVLRAEDLASLRRAHRVAEVLGQLEGRRLRIQSNLRVLEEIARIREVQARALVWLTFGSSLVLGLVFGSLVWMEFREERYLLALLRSFGVGRATLVLHKLGENLVLAGGGTGLGLAMLWWAAHRRWGFAGWQFGSLEVVDSGFLWAGAIGGAVLSCVPVAVGLGKPVGLVLK